MTANYFQDGRRSVFGQVTEGWDELKTWFYGALSGVTQDPDDEYRRAFAKFLDSEHRVIIETDAKLVVGFDAHKFRSFTNEAIAAGNAD